ncbi:MAG: isopentenyl phosphate kinase family protein [Methanomicrobiaceae archaeon]|uniref:Isopentenyl phosphate kinase n=1 Tax=hydrocarbon metagenome TaxID=938273 RepID=A0A0W8FFN3_9ZZZZ|nr:isopentenyl phosphate kinase family protein [Methanomicrobiaceae archaeon]MDD5420104.1 isopentenyl phosphate kinase [Methanomicrobiaceae archaeon]
MTETVVLKLGGSVITDKSGACAIDHARLERIASDIAAREGLFVILIHGAGSCGHPEARRFRLDRGLDGENTAGIYRTHAAVCRLNDAVVDALRNEGIEALGVHPLGMALADDGRLVRCETAHIRLMLKHGVMPVLHGDVVMDLTRGASIVSGDQLVAHLAEAVQVSRVGLATDVPGVLCGGTVMPRIDRNAFFASGIAGSQATDVTGGMKGKVAELLALAEKGIESNIFHVSRIGAFLDLTDHGGTVVAGSR